MYMHIQLYYCSVAQIVVIMIINISCTSISTWEVKNLISHSKYYIDMLAQALPEN